jgi:enoyl-[acyl-carrier protein] reductase I
MGILSGKKALILGVANDMSIAWGIARELKEHGASVAMTYLNDQLKKRVLPLAEEVGADFTCEMDVTNDAHFPALKAEVEKHWGKFDILVHSLAFADRNDLKNPFVQTSRAGFAMACDVSAYSLVALCQALKDNMNANSSVISLTYHGSQQVVTNYNVMGVAKAALEASNRYLADDLGPQGIRVNSISAGPIRTLAASGVSGLKNIFAKVEERAPLRRNVTTQEVGGAAVFLASDLSKGVTGQIIYVDSGASILAFC